MNAPRFSTSDHLGRRGPAAQSGARFGMRFGMQFGARIGARIGAAALLAVTVLLASCTSPGPGGTTPSGGTAPSGGSSGATRPPPTGSGKPPIADRGISLTAACKQTEEDGFREEAQLTVQNNEVRALEWQLWVGRRGSCKFSGNDFTQRQTRPHIELLAKDGSGCKLMVWQDPRRITLAHNNCQKLCSKGIYDEAWPVMFDPATGGCAKGR